MPDGGLRPDSDNADTMIITSHGIKFIRTGSCEQCGACGCGECPHHIVTEDVHSCLVYDRRSEECPSCAHTDNDGTHANCIKFPDNPWVWVARRGVCGYVFERVDGVPMDDLPFLNGKTYRWR